MKYTLYYAHAKLKAVKGKRLQGNTGMGHLTIVRWNLLKRNLSVTRRKENRQIGYRFCIEQYKNICCVCNRFLYKRSVHIFGKSKYSCQNFFSVQSSFDGKQSVCKTCHLIQTFSTTSLILTIPPNIQYHCTTHVSLILTTNFTYA